MSEITADVAYLWQTIGNKIPDRLTRKSIAFLDAFSHSKPDEYSYYAGMAVAIRKEILEFLNQKGDDNGKS